MMRFRYFIWDFDGTIYDMYPPVIEAMIEALAGHHIQVAAEEIVALLDQPLLDVVNLIADQHRLDREGFQGDFLVAYRQHDPEGQPLIDGVREILLRIKEAGGQHFLFTHRKRETLNRILARHGLMECFSEIRNTEDGFPRKPAPEGFRYFLEKHHLTGDQVLAVGDRELDIQAARGAGVKTCLYRTSYTPTLEADYIITSYSQLEAILFP